LAPPSLGRDEAPAGPVIKGFVEGGFSVEGAVYPALFLTPTEALSWSAPTLADLAIADLHPVLALDPAPEFLLLGTGTSLRFPPRAFREALEQKGIGLEVMDSRAAARVWGLLRGEERWIVAALMPLS
jgi:uncharacterized protein